MTQKCKVSVCIPSYNHHGFIGDCVKSVLDQDFDDFEIIIQDDFSSDGTWDVIRSMTDPRIDAKQNLTNLGISANWNECVGRAQGELIVMLPSDDMLDAKHLSSVVRLMDTHQNVGFLGVAVDYIDPGGESCGGRYRRGLDVGEFEIRSKQKRLWAFAFHSKLTFPGTIFRRSVYDQIGGFNENMTICEDWDFWVRCLLVSDEGFLNQKLVHFRWHPTNTSGNKRLAYLHFLEADDIQLLIMRNVRGLAGFVLVSASRVYLIHRTIRAKGIPIARKIEVLKKMAWSSWRYVTRHSGSRD